ncbi:hypothetical protein [Pseudosporangium ferrugineum]|uniref:Uncharacterized protein n=1 Tax=Pseudosporangium ferrugineum TaxID=439699 RepID=A0A2T0SIZ4_9ACTN|nr:hypothetical protein [Pseudosporangium ferrugineum]PRY33389.1 hypothetical protein CLV70_101551 [Pseudosporangium ferrugineum]
MTSWIRNRYVWAATTLLATAGAAVLLRPAAPADLRGQLSDLLRTTLEQTTPEQHRHAGHQPAERAPVICGVRVYGHEPASATALAEVRRIYGFHLCGVAEEKRPWDVAVKLAGPVIVDLSTRPPGIQVVEATDGVPYADRLGQLFPPPYADLARREALTDAEMTGLRRRYDTAARL